MAMPSGPRRDGRGSGINTGGRPRPAAPSCRSRRHAMNRDSMVDLEEGVLAPTAMASPLLLLIVVVYYS
jgi:hypothetical protein